MNKFLRVVTAPARAVRDGVRLARMGKHARELLQTADEAAEHPELYRSAAWWSRALAQASKLWSDLPLPKEVKEMKFLKGLLANWKTTLAGAALITGAGSHVANGGAVDEATLTAFVAGVGLILGKDHNTTGGSRPQTEEAKTRAEK